MLLSLKGNFPSAILALADGTVFIGNSIGAPGTTVGEVVFNTSLTGYQEILTDPSYCQQIVTLTYPHIGNYGVNPEDVEADKIHAAGLIIKNLPLLASNFRSTQTLSEYLTEGKTVAIANIDTRKLTRLLRDHGAQNGAIVGLAAGEEVTQAKIDEAIAAAKAGKMVICEKPIARNSEEALTMTEAVEAAGVANMVSFNYRRMPAVMLAKQLIDQGKLGKIFHYRANFLQDWTISADVPQGGMATWRLDAKAAGSGVTGDLLAHCIDLALW